MNIAIDVRPLTENNLTGVGEYTYNILTNILKTDQDNSYYLFFNSYKPNKKRLENFKIFPNVTFCEFNYPNKFFNLGLILKIIKIDKLIEKTFNTTIDLFFFPNMGFINISKKCKYIITVHDISFIINPKFFSFKRNLWHKIIGPKKLFSYANKIITVSENTKNDLIDIFNINIEKIKAIHLGIDSKYKEIEITYDIAKKIRKKYHLPDEFIFYLGTLEPRKNIESLITAFEKINSEHFLVIAGANGWKFKKIYTLANNSSKKDKIIFTGYVKNQDKKYLYNMAKIFIYPSFYEGFGFPPLEAAACGCPVITSINSSLCEVCKDSALLIDPFNINQLSNAIDVLIKDRNLRENLIKKGAENALKYNWELCTKETWAEIKKQNL